MLNHLYSYISYSSKPPFSREKGIGVGDISIQDPRIGLYMP